MWRIDYTPRPTKALTFPENCYFSLASAAALNVGTGDFGFSFIFYADPTIATVISGKLLVGKGALVQENVASWWTQYNASLERVSCYFNDGSATAVSVIADSGSILKGYWYWLFYNFDRSGNLDIWAGNFSTGVLTLIKSGAISSRAGSWSNTEDFTVGNWDTGPANRFFSGYLGFLRYDVGRLATTDWITKEWDRIRFGLPRLAQGFTETWLFDDTLVGVESGYTLVYNGAGAVAYGTGAPSSTIQYSLPSAPVWGSSPGNWLDNVVFERASDNTSRSYRSDAKLSYELEFRGMSFTQKTALEAMKHSEQSLYLYEDSAEPWSMEGEVKSLEIDPIPGFDSDGEKAYSGSMEIQQI